MSEVPLYAEMVKRQEILAYYAQLAAPPLQAEDCQLQNIVNF